MMQALVSIVPSLLFVVCDFPFYKKLNVPALLFLVTSIFQDLAVILLLVHTNFHCCILGH